MQQFCRVRAQAKVAKQERSYLEQKRKSRYNLRDPPEDNTSQDSAAQGSTHTHSPSGIIGSKSGQGWRCREVKSRPVVKSGQGQAFAILVLFSFQFLTSLGVGLCATDLSQMINPIFFIHFDCLLHECYPWLWYSFSVALVKKEICFV